MGKQYAQQVESTVKLIQDPVITEYVNRIGQNLVRNSDSQVPFTIKVIDADDINAFALPGGFFYVNSGCNPRSRRRSRDGWRDGARNCHVAALPHCASDDPRQPRAVRHDPFDFHGRLGRLRHLPRRWPRSARGIHEVQPWLRSRADYLGVQYMYKAGYDPQAYVNFFEKVQAQEKKKPGTMAKVFSDHPQTPDRIAKSQQEIAQILPAKQQYVVSTSEFDDVKSRLAALENAAGFSIKKIMARNRSAANRLQRIRTVRMTRATMTIVRR